MSKTCRTCRFFDDGLCNLIRQQGAVGQPAAIELNAADDHGVFVRFAVSADFGCNQHESKGVFTTRLTVVKRIFDLEMSDEALFFEGRQYHFKDLIVTSFGHPLYGSYDFLVYWDAFTLVALSTLNEDNAMIGLFNVEYNEE
jgi:hypothetical protein